MKVGIVDIGSNTIRLVVYDVIDMTYKEILNQRSFAGIIEYVDDDRLSQTGMDKLVKTLSNIKELTYLVRCDKVFYFATASLRGLNNSIDLLTYIKKELGIVTFSKELLINTITLNFNPGEKYSLSDLKVKLGNLYNSINYDATPKASDIENYFDVKSVVMYEKKEDGTRKQIRGYELLKRK